MTAALDSFIASAPVLLCPCGAKATAGARDVERWPDYATRAWRTRGLGPARYGCNAHPPAPSRVTVTNG